MVLGNGPHKVIALHGWFGSAHGWGPLYQMLDPGAFTYVFMNYRGYGESIAKAGAYTMDEIARDTLTLADALHWERFSLIGHSMGGMAIQRVLLEAPERIRKLVAITPVPASGVPFDAQAWKLFSSAARDPEARRTIIDMSTGGRHSAYWIGKLVEHSLHASSHEAFGAYLAAWAKSDFSAAIAGNPVPVKVIVGENDPGLNADFMRATYLRWYPNAVLESMPNAGHYPMDETPVALASSIESFLQA
jgi:pimeloyl-ACP methyl ester carboxylesterase